MRDRLRLRSYAIAVFILVGTLAQPGLAQDCTVSTVIRVLDKYGQPVEHVTADEVKAEIDGSIAKVSSFEPSKPGIFLLIDASSSMKHAWVQSIAAARQFIWRTGENIGVFVFRDRILNRAIGRLKSEELLDQLSRTRPTELGGTALYDTLIEIAGEVNPMRNAAIVVISDGGDNTSHYSANSAAGLFPHSSWPPVFGLILDYGQTDKRQSYFKKIPTATGGLITYASSASKVATATEELASEVLSSFILKLQPARPMTQMAKLKLEVVGSEGKPRQDLKLLYVAEIPPCGSQSPTAH